MKHFILIGHPLGHSLSPQIHGAGYNHLGLDCDYTLVDCPDEAAVDAQVSRLRQDQISGANVTVPWKRYALSRADSVDESALETGAANVLAKCEDGSIRAFNTDAPALATLLRRGRQARPSAAAVVLGNGGAALAGVVACQRAGAEQVYVSARKFRSNLPRDQWPGANEFEAKGARICAWVGPGELSAEAGPDAELLQEVFARSEIILQCTSAGMLGAASGEGLAALVPWQRLPKGACVYDVVYNPRQTPFLRAARAAGLHAEGGLSMLVGQAALAFELWLGRTAPVSEMNEAAERALFGGGP